MELTERFVARAQFDTGIPTVSGEPRLTYGEAQRDIADLAEQHGREDRPFTFGTVDKIFVAAS